MSATVSISNNTSPWQLWSDGAETFSYSPTGAGTSVTSSSTQPSWVVAAMFATLATTAGMTPTMTLKSLVGTGGSAENLISDDRTDATAREFWKELFERVGEQPAADAAAVLGGADLISEIKATLGVSVTDLAGIIGVSRQAIYDWIGDGQVSDANYERLLELRQVCLDWRARANRPLGHLLRTKSAEGDSLLGLLRQEPLNRQLIKRHLDALTRKAAEQEEQRKARKAKLAPLSDKDRYENALTHAIPATHS